MMSASSESLRFTHGGDVYSHLLSALFLGCHIDDAEIIAMEVRAFVEQSCLFVEGATRRMNCRMR